MPAWRMAAAIFLSQRTRAWTAYQSGNGGNSSGKIPDRLVWLWIALLTAPPYESHSGQDSFCTQRPGNSASRSAAYDSLSVTPDPKPQ